MKQSKMYGLTVLHAANRRQADRWIRRLKRAGHVTARRRVPIPEHVKLRGGDYMGDRAYCDVLTDAVALPR